MTPDDPLYEFMVQQGLIQQPAQAGVLPRATAAAGQAQEPQVLTLPQAAMRYRNRANQLTASAEELAGQDVDVSALQNYARQRGEQGGASMLNALAAQFAGEQFAPVGAQYLKRALSAQDPIKTGGGVITPTGEYLRDPYAAQERQYNALVNQAKAYEQMALTAQTADERAQATAAQKQIENTLRLLGLNIQSQKAGEQTYQNGSPFALPSGEIVGTVFDRKTGKRLYETPDGLEPLPQGSRPATAATGGPLSADRLGRVLEELNQEETAILRLDNYLKTIGNTNIGFRRLADQIAANAKTLFGSGKLSPKELAAQTGEKQLQSLLGLMRETVVGPGVMTEYDAKRVIMALGGDFNALQNPEVVESLLRDISEDKRRHIKVLQQQRDYSARFFPGMGTPQPGGGGGSSSGGSTGNTPLSPEEARELEELRKRLGRG